MRRGLRVRSMPETLHDEILRGRHPVVIAGTHGKTTTTALTAWLLASAGRDPGYLVGGEPVNFPGPAALGTGRPFVIEGDEYSTSYADKGPKFLHYAPRTFVLTSVEFDHADLYSDLAAVKGAFRAGVAIVPADGRIVANADDPNVREVLGEARARVALYSLEDAAADVFARDVRETEEGTFFEVLHAGVPFFRGFAPPFGSPQRVQRPRSGFRGARIRALACRSSRQASRRSAGLRAECRSSARPAASRSWTTSPTTRRPSRRRSPARKGASSGGAFGLRSSRAR